MTAIAPSILIVEDDPAHAEAIRRAFQAASAESRIQVVGTLREYYQAAAACPPDIALVDLNLPDGSAMEILTSPPEVGPFPILVMTSYGDEHIAVEAMKAGALDYVAKSAEAFADMPRAVRRALDQWELLLRSRWTEEELRQSEQTLRHTLAELETLHANAPVVMMLMDRQWRVTKAGGAAARRAGRTEQEMVGLPCGVVLRCLNALDNPKGCGAGPSCASCLIRLAILDTFATGKEHRQVEAWMPFPVGDKAEDRCLLASTALLKLDDAERVLLCVQDITDLKRAEEENRRLASIVDRATVSIFIYDFDGRALYANQRTCDLHGYSSKEEFMAINLHLLDTPESTALITTRIKEIREKGEATFEVAHFRKERSVLPLEVSASLIQWDGREAVLNFTTDLTDRKKAEEQLRTLAARNEAILAAVPEIVAQTDLAKVYTWLNEAGIEFFGPDAVGREASDYFVGAQDTYEKVKPIFDGGENDICLESWQRRKDGQKRLLSWRSRALKDGSGNMLGILSTARDITDSKKTEEQLTVYQRRLRTLGAKLAVAEEQERRRIAADLHDDVAQNLSLAKLKLQTLRAHPDTAPEIVQEIEELVGHAILSTRSLLFELSPPPLYELGLEAAVEWLAEKTQAEHKLAVAVEDDRQPKPLGEEIRGILFRAVRELLHNTVKHANARKVGIAIRRDGPFIRVEVADDGAGVNLERARPPGDASGGFGLFQIRERLDYFGGRMEIHSGRERGTRVVLLAPLQKETPKT